MELSTERTDMINELDEYLESQEVYGVKIEQYDDDNEDLLAFKCPDKETVFLVRGVLSAYGDVTFNGGISVDRHGLYTVFGYAN
jgi:hypothetical protein